MAKCNCGAQTCGCRIEPGEGVSIEGAGTPGSPWVISAEGGGGGDSGWASGDLKDTVRTVTDAGWLECNGQAVSRATYPSLFTAIGTTWGSGDGINTFNLPNFAGMFRMGAGPGFPAGGSGGVRDTTLLVENLPPHTHTISHNHSMLHTHTMVHTHSMAHTHTINHDHPAVTSSEAGDHRHTVAKESDTVSQGGGANKTVIVPGDGADINTSLAGDHTHSVNVPAYVGTSGASSLTDTGASSAGITGGSNNGNTGVPSTPNSGSTGAAASFTNLPPYRAVRVLIKT